MQHKVITCSELQLLKKCIISTNECIIPNFMFEEQCLSFIRLFVCLFVCSFVSNTYLYVWDVLLLSDIKDKDENGQITSRENEAKIPQYLSYGIY